MLFTLFTSTAIYTTQKSVQVMWFTTLVINFTEYRKFLLNYYKKPFLLKRKKKRFS